MPTHTYRQSLNHKSTRPYTKPPHPPSIPRQRRSVHGQRKPIPKLKLSDPFADLWKCRAFAAPTQGCTPSEITSDITEIHARILDLATATATAGDQIPSQSIPKPANVRGVKKRAAKPAIKKVERLGLRRSSRSAAHSEVPRDASGDERNRIGRANDAGKVPQVICIDLDNYWDEEANAAATTALGYTGEEMYNRDKVEYGDEESSVTSPSVRQEEGGEEIRNSITISETDWDDDEGIIDTTTTPDSEGDEYDEEIQESTTTVLDMNSGNEMYPVLPGAVSSGIYLGNQKQKRQSGISEFFKPNSHVEKKGR